MIGPQMNAPSNTTLRLRARKAVRPLRLTLTAAAALVATSAVATRADAQEIQLTGPLAGAPAVRHEQLYREGRFEIAPTVSFTLLDSYNRTILFGGRAQYNITDWFSVGVWGAYGAVQVETNLAEEINQQAPREAQTAVNIPGKGGDFDNQLGYMQWIVVPQVQITPFRGKLAIFQKIFVNADAYVHAGLGIIGLQERGNCGSSGQVSCTAPSSFSTSGQTAFSPTFGLGFNFYFLKFMSLGLEYRALPFSWNQGGFDVAGGPPNGNFPDNKITSADSSFTFNQMLTISVGFSFPTTPKLSE
jgi:outer membrane beta-barrel protein